MSGLGGRPKGGSVKKDDGYDKNIASEKPIVANKSDNKKFEADKDSLIGFFADMISDVDNIEALKKGYKELCKKDPAKALMYLDKWAEYIAPKQQRTDNKNDGVSGINIVFAPSSTIKQEPKKKISIDEFVPTNK